MNCNTPPHGPSGDPSASAAVHVGGASASAPFRTRSTFGRRRTIHGALGSEPQLPRSKRQWCSTTALTQRVILRDAAIVKSGADEASTCLDGGDSSHASDFTGNGVECAGGYRSTSCGGDSRRTNRGVDINELNSVSGRGDNNFACGSNLDENFSGGSPDSSCRKFASFLGGLPDVQKHIRSRGSLPAENNGRDFDVHVDCSAGNEGARCLSPSSSPRCSAGMVSFSQSSVASRTTGVPSRCQSQLDPLFPSQSSQSATQCPFSQLSQQPVHQLWGSQPCSSQGATQQPSSHMWPPHVQQLWNSQPSASQPLPSSQQQQQFQSSSLQMWRPCQQESFASTHPCQPFPQQLQPASACASQPCASQRSAAWPSASQPEVDGSQRLLTPSQSAAVPRGEGQRTSREEATSSVDFVLPLPLPWLGAVGHELGHDPYMAPGDSPINAQDMGSESQDSMHSLACAAGDLALRPLADAPLSPAFPRRTATRLLLANASPCMARGGSSTLPPRTPEQRTRAGPYGQGRSDRMPLTPSAASMLASPGGYATGADDARSVEQAMHQPRSGVGAVGTASGTVTSALFGTPSLRLDPRSPPPAPSWERERRELQEDVETALEWRSAPLLHMALLRLHDCAEDHPLHEAIRQRHLAALEFLLRGYGGVNGELALEEPCATRRPLLEAIHCCGPQGDVGYRMAELLLRFGANPNGLSEDNEESPLCVAASLAFPDLVTLLLDHRADPNLAVRGGCTPLHAACRLITSERGVSTTEALLRRGADPAMQDHLGRLPEELALLVASRSERLNGQATTCAEELARTCSVEQDVKPKVSAPARQAYDMLVKEARWRRRRHLVLARTRLSRRHMHTDVTGVLRAVSLPEAIFRMVMGFV